MKSIDQWFDEYGESHQNKINKLIHWLCVPTIFFSIIALASEITFPVIASVLPETLLPYNHLGTLLVFMAFIFYVILSPKISIGLLLFSMVCLVLVTLLNHLPFPVWQSALFLFVIAWIGQFYGHKVEGKKPSFLKDLVFLLIGPAWLMGFVYRRLSLTY